MSDNDYIELNPAFWWDCPKCKARNFERGRVMSKDVDGDIFTLLQDEMFNLGGDEEVTASEIEAPLIGIPSDVICASCMVSYRSFPLGVSPEDFEEIDDDDDDD